MHYRFWRGLLIVFLHGIPPLPELSEQPSYNKTDDKGGKRMGKACRGDSQSPQAFHNQIVSEEYRHHQFP